MEDYSKYSLDELKEMLKDAEPQGEVESTYADAPKPEGRALGFFERHGTEAEAATGVRPSDAYNDPTVGKVIDLAYSVAPFAGTAARAIAGRRQKSLDAALETGDAGGAFGGMDEAMKEWDATEGAKYDLYQRALNGDADADYSPLYAKRFNAKTGRYEIDRDDKGRALLDGRYATPKDEARRAYVKGLAAGQISQTARAKENAQKDLASNTASVWMNLAHGATASLGFAGEFYLGGALAKGALGTAALAGTKLGKAAQIAEAGGKLGLKARTALASAELAAPTIVNAIARYENLTANDYRMDEDGNVELTELGDGAFRAGAKALGGASFENATEVALGKVVNKVFGATCKGIYNKVPGVKKLFDGAVNKVGDRTIDAAKRAWMSATRTYATVQKAAHFELMPVGEFAEEYVQGMGDDVLGFGNRADAKDKRLGEFTRDFIDWDAGFKDLFFGVMGQTIALGLGAHGMRRANDFKNSVDAKVIGTLKLHGYNAADIAKMGTNARLGLAMQLSDGKATKEMGYGVQDYADFLGIRQGEVEQFTKDMKAMADAEAFKKLSADEQKRIAANVIQFTSVLYNTASAFERGDEGVAEMMNRLNSRMRKAMMLMEERQGLGNSRNNAGTKPQDFASRVDWTGTSDAAGNINWQTDEATGRQFIESAQLAEGGNGVRIFREGDRFRVVHPQGANRNGYLADDLKTAHDYAASLDQFAQKKNADRAVMRDYVKFNAQRLVPQAKGKDGKTANATAPIVTANNAQDALDNLEWLTDGDRRELQNAMLDGTEGGALKLEDGTVLVLIDNLRDTQDALLTLAHELGGHAALAEGTKANGLSLADTVSEVYKTSANKDEKQAATEYGIRMDEGADERTARAIAQEEGMVYGNEYRMPVASPLQQAKTAVKVWMKQHGMDAKLTDADYDAIAAAGLRRIRSTQTRTGDTGTDAVDGNGINVTPTVQGTDLQNRYNNAKWVSDYYAQREKLEAARAALDAAEAAQRNADAAAKEQAKIDRAVADEDERQKRLAEQEQMRKDAEHATKYGREMVRDVLTGWYSSKNIKPEQVERIVNGATDAEIAELLDFIELEMDGKASEDSVLEIAKSINADIVKRTVTPAQQAQREAFAKRTKEERKARIAAENALMYKFIETVQQNPNSALAFWIHNGRRLFAYPGYECVANKGKGNGFKFRFDGADNTIDALNAFFDGMHGAKKGDERKKWVRLVFGENAKPGDGNGDVAMENWIRFKKRGAETMADEQTGGLTNGEIIADADYGRAENLLNAFKKEYAAYEEWLEGGQLTAEEQRERDEIQAEQAAMDELSAEIADAEEAWADAVGVTADGKPVKSVADMKIGDGVEIGGEYLRVVKSDGDMVELDADDGFGTKWTFKFNKENGGWEYVETQDAADEGGQDRDRAEDRGDAERDGSEGREDGDDGAAGGKDGGNGAAAKASSADTAQSLTLDGGTAQHKVASAKATAEEVAEPSKPQMSAKDASKALGTDAALNDRQLAQRMKAWEAHAKERPEFAKKLEVAKVVLEYRKAKGKADPHATEVEARPKTEKLKNAEKATEDKYSSLTLKELREHDDRYSSDEKVFNAVEEEIARREDDVRETDAYKAYAKGMAVSDKELSSAIRKWVADNYDRAESIGKRLMAVFSDEVEEQIAIDGDPRKEGGARKGVARIMPDMVLRVHKVVAEERDAEEARRRPETPHWIDLNGTDRGALPVGFSAPTKENVKVGGVAVIRNDRNTSLYDGEIVSVGPKNVKIRSKSSMYGEQVLSFDRRWIVGVNPKDTEAAKARAEAAPNPSEETGEVKLGGPTTPTDEEGEDLFNRAKWRRSAVTPAEDAAYMDAVKRGDMETARRMVREAAAKAMPNTKVVDKDGLPKVVWHGTENGGFTEFDTDGDRKSGKTGAWFSLSKEYSEYGFAGKDNVGGLYGCFLKLNNPVVFDFENEMYDSGWTCWICGKKEGASPEVGYHGSIKQGELFLTEEVAREFAKENGLEVEESSFTHDELVSRIRSVFDDVKPSSNLNFWRNNINSLNDSTKESVRLSDYQCKDLKNYLSLSGVDIEHIDGVILKNIGDRDRQGLQYLDDQMVVFSPSQIKSADPVTYDDAGNVIPLSRRFDETSDDIRFRRRTYSPNLPAQSLADQRIRSLTDALRESKFGADSAALFAAEKMARELAQQGSIDPALRDLIERTQTGSAADRAKGNAAALLSPQNLSRWRELMQDSLISLREMEDRLGLKKDASAYHQFDRNYGLVAKAADDLDREIVTPLAKELKDNGIPLADFSMLLQALHGPERNRMIAERSPYVRAALDNAASAPYVTALLAGNIDIDEAQIDEICKRLGWLDKSGVRTKQGRQFAKDLAGSGATTAFWNGKVDAFRASGMLAKAQKAIRLVRRLTRRNRALLVATGRMSRAQASLWAKLSPNYVPLRSDMEMDTNVWSKWLLGGGADKDGANGKRYSDNEYNHAYGRGTLADNPLEFALQQYQESLQRAYDNVARRRLAEIVRDNPNLGKVFRYEPQMTPTKRAHYAKEIAIIRNMVKAGTATASDIRKLHWYEEAFNADTAIPTIRVLGANGVIHEMPNLAGLEGTKDKPTGVIAFKEDGELKFIRLGGFDQADVSANPALLDDVAARRIATAVKKQNMAQLNGFGRAMRKATGVFSALRTAYSPTFLISNLGADNTQAARNIYATFGVKAVGKFEHYAAHAFKAAQAVVTGRFDNTKIQQYAQEWYENGGKIGGMATASISDLTNDIKRTMRQLNSQKQQLASIQSFGGLMRWMTDRKDQFEKFAEHWNGVIEMSTRIAAYATARDMGQSVEDAVSYSRDITVNFNRKGTITPWTNALYAFSNATMQDLHRSLVAFGEGNYAKGSGILAKRGAVMGFGLMMMGFLASVFGFWQDDDKDEREGKAQWRYAKDWEKQNTLGVRIGEKTYGVPIRGISRVPYYLGHQIWEAMSGRKGVAKAAIDTATLALSNVGDFMGQASSPLMTAVPSLARDPIDIFISNRTFTGRQRYREPLPGQEQTAVRSEMGRKDTSEAAKAVARALNWMTGGDEKKRGLIDVQPEKVQGVWEWLFGSAGKDISNIVGTAKDAATLNLGNRDLRNIPYLSRFARNLSENSADYYEARSRYEQAKKHYNGMNELGREDEMRKDAAEHPWLSSRGSGKRWGEELKDLDGAVKKLMELEKAASAEDYDAIHGLRLKTQYQFMRRLETAPADDAEGVAEEKEHRRALAPLLRSSKRTDKAEQREMKKRKRLF